MAVNQAYLFLIFTLNGIFIGLVFDFFRILRQGFKTNNVITLFLIIHPHDFSHGVPVGEVVVTELEDEVEDEEAEDG